MKNMRFLGNRIERVFFAMVVLFASISTACSQFDMQKPDSSKCIVVFSTDSVQRQANPLSLDVTSLKYKLSYYQTENDSIRTIGEEAPISYSALRSIQLEIEEGEWIFNLSAYNLTQEVLYDSIETTINRGQNLITFNLKEAESGSGNIDVTLTFSVENASVRKVSAILYDFSSNNVVLNEKVLEQHASDEEDFYYVNYKTESYECVEKGMYVLYFMFYADDARTYVLGSYPEFVIVAPGATSKSSPVTEEITETFSITYQDMTDEDGSSWWKTSEIPFAFNSYKTVYLPLADCVYREGYSFEGWYLSSDFEGDPIFKIDSSVRNNVVLYAKWERIKVESNIIVDLKSVYKAGDSIEVVVTDEYGDIVSDAEITAEVIYEDAAIEEAVSVTDNIITICETQINGLCNLRIYAAFNDTEFSKIFEINLTPTVYVTRENAFEIISTLTENTNIVFTGSIVASDIYSSSNSIREALYAIDSDITVSLDFSEALDLLSIPSDGFYMCNKIREIILPDTITAIGSAAFYGCKRLESIILKEGILSIGNYAFEYCSSLKSIELPSGPISMGSSVFYNCSSLITASIPSSVKAIGSETFENCYSLEEVSLEGAYTSIPEKMFFGCNSLKKVEIPQGVTSIEPSAFSGCSSLSDISMPDTLVAIGGGTFGNCSSLKQVNLPEDVRSLGSAVFAGCEKLQKITIPDSVTSIGRGAFSSCYSLVEIVIPDSVTSIESSTFDGCNSLCKVSIPDSVTSIGDSAFYRCSSLSQITIPDSVLTMGERVFENCKMLSSIKLSENLTTISRMLFYGCSLLPKIDIPDSVTSIEGAAFYGCSSLTTITIPKNVNRIYGYYYGHYAPVFSGCSFLAEIIFEDPENWFLINEADIYSGTDISDLDKTPFTATDSKANAEFLTNTDKGLIKIQ